MSDHGEALSIGELSDLSGVSDGETEIVMGRNPPSRGHLEKESSKLRSKFKILREALIDEKLADLDQKIEEIERDADPAVAHELRRLENQRKERLRTSHERKRAKVETILNEYKSRVQEVEDTQRALDQELAVGAVRKARKGRRKRFPSQSLPEAVDDDLKVIRTTIDAMEEAKMNNHPDLIHSD